MAKKGPLGKAETFYIDNHFQDSTAEDLAKDLDRTVRAVRSYIKKTHLSDTNANPAGQHFARQSGATIMTETASQVADHNRQRSMRQPTCITKIKEETDT
tara:strand:- start:2318 stop:2617 length:300 start_codon:yes stop_codon:yes gene_type:complete